MLLPLQAWPAAPAGVTEQREQLAALRARIADLRRQSEAKAGEKDELSTLLGETERRIGRLSTTLRDIDAKLEHHRRHLRGLEQSLGEQRDSLQRQRDALARQVRAAYAMGRQERLKILLNQQDPAVLGRAMAYHEYLGRARAAKMDAIRHEMQRLSETEAATRTEQRELARLQEVHARERAALQRAQTQRRELLERLTREMSDQGREIERLEADARRLQLLLDGLGEALADIPLRHPRQVRFAGLKGRLPWPAGGAIVSRFGSPRLGSLVWDGVMIETPTGGEVRAVHHGRVAFADWLRGFGLLLIVDHGDGYMTLYGNNQSLFKEVGDWVEAREPIAQAGTSGGRDVSGVYFAIRHRGRAVDPARWCRRSGAALGRLSNGRSAWSRHI